MTADEFPAESFNRILVAIEESLGVLARKQQISREDFKADSDTRDIVERRFVKLTEASIDIGEGLNRWRRTVIASGLLSRSTGSSVKSVKVVIPDIADRRL